MATAREPFPRDPDHWLRRLSPEEWIRAALGELRRAEEAFARHDSRAAVAGCKRAAGMALNGALLVRGHDRWGRTYVEHLEAVAVDDGEPAAVREACRVVLGAQGPAHGVIPLRGVRSDARIVEAAKDVLAHAYAVVHGSTGQRGEEPTP